MKTITTILKLLSRIRAMHRQVKELEDQLKTVQTQLAKYQAKADALAVPPGSTLFGGDQVRQFRITADNGETLTGKLQTINAAGELIDDPDETDNFSILKPDPDQEVEPASGGDPPMVVPATFEGLSDAGVQVWVLAGTPGDSLPPPGVAYQTLQLDEFGEPVWGWVRIAPEEA